MAGSRSIGGAEGDDWEVRANILAARSGIGVVVVGWRNTGAADPWGLTGELDFRCFFAGEAEREAERRA